MDLSLGSDETLLREGAANLQRGVETVGGQLRLTDRRLLFTSHGFNVQNGSTSITLADIVQVRPCWTRLLNLVPVFPNSLAVETRDGGRHCFVLYRRGAWADAITAQRCLQRVRAR